MIRSVIVQRIIPICMLAALLLARVPLTYAALPPDPYADAVDASTGGVIVAPANAVGAADGQSALIASVIGNDLVLDMGAGEEGTGNLKVYYGGLSLGVATTVDFLRADHSVISSSALNLVSLGVGAFVSTVTYSSAPTPYRFVRLKSTVLGAYLVDAVETLSYTFDSDGDGLPDAWEVAYGLDRTSPFGVNGANGDPDSDGLINAQEYLHGTNPKVADTDGDGLPDGWEVQYGLNPLSTTGADGASGDPDADSLTNAQEYAAGTSPISADTDGDTLPDTWEIQYGLNPASAVGADGAAGNPDADGLTNVQELVHGTNPKVADTDGDGLPDGWEVQYGLDPLSATGVNGASGDPDGDSKTNLQEYIAGTNPTAADTDNDGLPDAWETQHGLNPNSATGDNGAAGDPDHDGLTNIQEFALGSDPRNADTDGDGLPDGWEVQNGLDLLSATGTNGAAGDPDHDGATNAQEYAAGTLPTNPDTDGDTLLDGWEIHYTLDPLSATGDNGAAGDPDHDGLTNSQEQTAGTDPKNPDTDGDGLSDGWEVQNGLDPLDPTGDNGANGDPDHDGLTNAQEAAGGTDPTSSVALSLRLYLPAAMQ